MHMHMDGSPSQVYYDVKDDWDRADLEILGRGFLTTASGLLIS